MDTRLLHMLALLLAACVLGMIRACRESERFALNTSQRYVRLIGPGLFLKFPGRVGPYRYTRVRIGDEGRYVGDGWAEINGGNMPVDGASAFCPGQPLRVQAFVDQQIHVVAEHRWGNASVSEAQ